MDSPDDSEWSSPSLPFIPAQVADVGVKKFPDKSNPIQSNHSQSQGVFPAEAPDTKIIPAVSKFLPAEIQ